MRCFDLQAIHDAGFVYRDMKPQNVLLDAQGRVRISDMGLAGCSRYSRYSRYRSDRRGSPARC